MKFNPNLFTQWFEKPKVSRFDRSCPKSFDMQIGKFYPAYWDMTGFGDNARGRSGHKLRLAPMIAPNFANFRFQEHSIAVPLRTILKDFQDKFNYAKNLDGARLPVLSTQQLLNIYQYMGSFGINPIGSLFDFLGYPVFGDFYDAVVDSINNIDLFRISEVDGTKSPFDPVLSTLTQANVRYRDLNVNIVSSESIDSMYLFALYRYGKSSSDYAAAGSPTGSDFVAFLSDGLTMTALMDQYLSYVFTICLSHFFGQSYESDSLFMEQEYSLLPLMAYHRAIADWNINSNITDPELYITKFVHELYSNLSDLALDDEDFVTAVTCADRLYDNDFFTSLLPTSSSGDAITIPANATVLDLASLSAVQKMVLKLSYSSRFRDQIWNLFNIQVSDAWLQQSTVLRSKTHNIQIGETIQTSETTTSSVLGSFSGRGFSAGRNKGYHIFCQEPCVIINFVSLVASPVYADCLHPLIKVDNILDFPLPGMDVLGNQPLRADFLSGNPGDAAYVLGYGRQYYEWLAMPGTVHGRMKTSLRYWDFTRRFNNTPAFNEDFVTLNPNDDFDDLFTVPDSSHAFVNIFYDCEVTRPIHRSVRIVI